MNLTLEEKAALCLGSTFWHTAPVERLGIPPASPVARPIRELTAFAEVDLPPGAGETVTFPLGPATWLAGRSGIIGGSSNPEATRSLSAPRPGTCA